MSQQLLAAFAAAKDLATTLITLSAAIIGVTITFIKDFETPGRWRYILVLTWLLLLASIFVGVFNLLALTGTLAASETPTDISDHIRNLAGWQEKLFFFGMIVLTVYGIVVLAKGPRQN